MSDLPVGTRNTAALATPTSPLPLLFPFTALVAQDALQTALLLSAIDPGLGGVLISGPRGTAKTTSARALAALLPEGQFVTLPLGASVTQLLGSLDLEAVLQDGRIQFSPGLLAKAHLGVLYVDEINLLPDALVDPLLDVASSGINRIEREGMSHSHAAKFVLIGTMNPEEGDLRPQLSDRFGLAVTLQNCRDAARRQEIVKSRLAFDSDATAFCAAYEERERDLSDVLHLARARLTTLEFSDAVHAHVSSLCIAADVDGMRADLVMLKAARALAALRSAAAVTIDHVDAVAELVLAHRRKAYSGRARSSEGHAAPGTDAVGDKTASGKGGKGGKSATGVPDGDDGDDGDGDSRGERGANGSASGKGRVGGEDNVNDTGDAGGRSGPRTAGVVTPESSDSLGGEAVREGTSDADWGYLAAPPVASARVKQARPIPLKKV